MCIYFNLSLSVYSAIDWQPINWDRDIFWKIGLLMMGHKLYMQGGYSHSLIIFFNGQQGAAPLVAKMLGRIES